ncbi:MAG: prepilin-type N-terminal cleavage/methylation domain-containing protein [Gammaproteobacteria bacterium]|jgi:type IV pilus assembly protein PilE|nr:prepilin-type N-terminal cleavage/methylation domain-containing protein [Gammaproteobacteria bacterium]
MKTLQNKRILGFTVIELMIVLAIVAVLMALAYPSYLQYVRKSHRGEAQQLLMNWAINQEIWRSNHTTYDGTTGMQPGNTTQYVFAVSSASATGYTLTATAQNDQAKDKDSGVSCAVLTLESTGQKYSAGDPTKTECWE